MAKKLMVVVKLEKNDAMRIHWKGSGKRPGRGLKTRLKSVRIDGHTVAVDSKNISEVAIPADGDRFEVFFMGYFEVEPTSGDHPHLAGKKDIAVEYDLGFIDDAAGTWATEGPDYEVLSCKPATLSAMG